MNNWFCTTHMKTYNKTQKLTKQNDRIIDFANTKRKKSVGTQSKKKHKIKHIYQMNALQQSSSMRTNLHQRAWQVRSKPGQRRQQEFCKTETPREKILKQKMLNFDWSNFFNEKSMAAPEWPGRVKIHQFGVSKILNMGFQYLGDRISSHWSLCFD